MAIETTIEREIKLFRAIQTDRQAIQIIDEMCFVSVGLSTV